MPLKKALLAGTSFSAIPLYHALKSHSIALSVCGNATNDPCHSYDSTSFLVDYSDKDALLDIVKSESFDYLIPSCNDYAYLSSSWVAEQLGLPGYDTFETTLILHNKQQFRNFTQQHGYPVPKAVELKQGHKFDTMNLRFPLLVKPTDSFSGRGVTKVMNENELSAATDNAKNVSRNNSVVVEEFVEGTLHSHSCFIQNGDIFYSIMADEFCSIYPYQVNCSNIPSKIPTAVQKKIHNCISDLIKQLNLVDGLLHTQLIIEGNQFWLIECMRRAPGDLYGQMVSLATGIEYSDLYVKPFINEPVPPVNAREITKNIARHTLSTSRAQPYRGFTIKNPKLFNQFSSIPLKESGHKLNPAPYDKAGIIFAELESRTLLFETAPHLAELFILNK